MTSHLEVLTYPSLGDRKPAIYDRITASEVKNRTASVYLITGWPIYTDDAGYPVVHRVARWLAPKGVAALVACHLTVDGCPWDVLAPLEVRKRCLADSRDCETLANEPTAARRLVKAATESEGWTLHLVGATYTYARNIKWLKPPTKQENTNG